MKQNLLLIIFTLLVIHIAAAQSRNSAWLEKLIRSRASDSLLHTLNYPDSFRYQLIYTQINRDKHNRPHFTHYYLHVDDTLYFNPASTVKLPTVLMALEKLNGLSTKGVDIHTTMLTDSAWSGQTRMWKDTTAQNGLPSIAQYVKKIFLVSDNDAYNRLHEFVGQQQLNEGLWKKGYTQTRITRRFVRLTPEQTRYTNPIRFVKDSTLIYAQAQAHSTVNFDFSKLHFVGNAHYNTNDSLVKTPMDFTTHNVFTLSDMQKMLQAILFPEAVPEQNRFQLAPDSWRFLYQYLSEYPRESAYPHYNTTAFFDSYAKFFFCDSRKERVPDYLRFFNKTGWSYGFLTDVCYVVDFKHHTEFMLTANIYVNRDGVINDDKYDYETIGRPFFQETGNIIYQYELSRHKKYLPDLSKFVVQYH
jgi:hypothetical protein